MKKRILSVLITVVMLIGMLPTAVFAADSHAHCICGETHASVGDHDDEVSTTFTAVTNQAELEAAAASGGSVYLTGDITLEAPLTVSQNLSLCLNGYDLIYNSADSVIIVSNSKTLNITDCGSTGTITGSTGDYGAVQNGTGTFNLYAGTITGNKRGVYNGGTFSMYGGNIGGNIAGNSDDGVWNAKGGTFTLHAGKITYNTGWGVNNNGGTFTMNGGEISHNSHNAAENAVKTGVMNDGTFTMNSGKISDNSGDGVMNNSLDSKFIMNDGEISGNSGDGVYNPSTFTMYDGEISSNTGDGVYTTSVFTMNGGEISGNDRGVMYEDGTASVSGAPVIKDNANGNFCDYQGTYYLTVSGALTDGTYIGVTLEETFGEAAGPSMYDDTLPAAPDYIEYFYSDEGYGIYAEGDSIFVGNYITEQPNAENNYKVKTNDDANAIYQWYSVETDEVTVTYDFLVEQDIGFNWMYGGNFDSETNKWAPKVYGGTGAYGYLFVALNAGETFIAEFDSALPAGYIALLVGWNNYNVIQATQQNGNIYTFKATEAGIYVLMVAEEDEEPVALSEVVIPNVACKMDAFVYTPLDGQNEATLDITGLESGAYICKTSWDIRGTPADAEDDYYRVSAPVTRYDVIFDYGTLGSETKTVFHNETVTPPAPVFAGKVLVGWYTDSNFTTEFNFSDAITADNITIYAKFTTAVAKIEKTSTEGLVDTYTITYTDGSTTTFKITNGADGQTAVFRVEDGKLQWKYTADTTWNELINIADLKGQDGKTPTFKVDNGNLFVSYDNGTIWSDLGPIKGDDGITPKLQINSETNEWEVSYDNGTTWTSLGVKATGATGAQGEKGEKGDTGATGATGAQGPQGVKGDTGATGNGIASITTSKENDITTVTIKFTDPNMADVVFTIEDGADGAKGDKGDTGATGATGAQGPQGEKGEKGDKGNTGAAGASGVGIAKIEKTSSDGNVDTYTITLTNGTTYTFTVTNGTDGTDGKDGVDGKDGTNGTNGVDGKDGANGADGQTPYIGENGNWWIGDTDTGVKAAGDDGKDGAIIVATAVGGTALISNIALIAWALIKKKRLF